MFGDTKQDREILAAYDSLLEDAKIRKGKMELVIADIARREFRVRDLKVQNRDEKDFSEVHVSAIKDALESAFKAGFKHGVEMAEHEARKNTPQEKE